MLADGGDVGADAQPCIGGGGGAVTAADLHLGLGRADVSLGLVVGEGHRQVAREQQYLMVAVAEAFEQVAGLGLAAPGCSAVFGEPDQQRVAPRVEQRIGNLGWNLG